MSDNGDRTRSSQTAKFAIHDTTITAASPVEAQQWRLNALQAPMTTIGDSTKKWNTAKLSARIGGDALAAASAGVLVAPLITMIDRGIIENASERRTLSQSIRRSISTLALRPHHFFFSKPFALVFALYFGTYFTANTVDTLTAMTRNRPASSVTSGTSKFLLTSSANLSLCLYKDSQFTRLFGAATSSPRPVPTASYFLFAARDAITVFASFNLPPILAPLLPVGDEIQRYMSRASIAQVIAPAAMQVFSTPLHLLGLDLYNRNGGTTMQMRLHKVAHDWAKSCLARMGRIVPAFGIGGVVNNGLRKKMMQQLE